MKGPSLYKPKMAKMDIQKDYAKKSDDRAMSSPYQKDDKVIKGKVLPTVEVSAKKDKLKITQNKDGGFTKSKGNRSQTFKPNPNYKKGSARTTNYRYITGESDSTGAPIGTNNIG
jgi:hypothetical protein